MNLDADEIVDVKCAVFQLINPADGTRTKPVSLPLDEVLGVLSRCSQDAYVNIFTLDSTLEMDPNFMLLPLVRVSSFVETFKEKFSSIEHKGI